MIDQRLTAKDELTETPHDDDVVHIVDVSDTTHSPEGTSKKIKYSNLRSKVVSTEDSSNIVTFENPIGKFYNTDVPNGNDIILNSTGGVFGGTAIVYSMGVLEPNITGGNISLKVGNYNTDGQTLNIIFISMDVKGSFLINIVDNSFTGYTPSLNTETQALISQGTLDGYVVANGYKLNKLNEFIQGLIDNDIWSELDRAYITETNGDSGFSRYDIKNPTVSGNILSLLGTPTFNPLSGWNGAATHAMNTNFKPLTDGVKFQQDSSSFILYETGATTGYLGGVIDSVDSINRILIGQTSTNLLTAINGNIDNNTNPASNSVIHVNRSAATDYNVYVNGALLVNELRSSKTLTNEDVYILARNVGGVDIPSNGTVGICFIGGDLSSKAAIINTLIQNYLG